MAHTKESIAKMLETRRKTLAAKAARAEINRKNASGKRRKRKVLPNLAEEFRNAPYKELPIIEVTNGHRDAEEFGAFMAAAWKVYKQQ